VAAKVHLLEAPQTHLHNVSVNIHYVAIAESTYHPAAPPRLVEKW